MPPHKLLHKEKSVLRNVNFLRLLSVLSLFHRYNQLIVDAYPLYIVAITCYQDWEHKALCFLDFSYFFLLFEFSSWVLYFTRVITFRFFRIAKNQCYLWLYFPNCDLVYFHESKFVNLRSNIFNNIWQPLTWYKSKTFDICQTLKLNRLNTPLISIFPEKSCY